MAEITVPGPLSSRPYMFRIAGDSPSVDEQQRIDAHIRQAEQGFLQEYEQTMGRPLDTGEGEGILNWLGELPKGLVRGTVGLGESALLGAGALLPESAEDPFRELIRRGAYSVSPQADIGMEDTISGGFGQALGSTVPFFLAGPAGAALLATASGAGEASERARSAGATVEERNAATLLGAPVGLSEVLLPQFIKGLGRDAALSIAQRLGRIAASAGIEGAQEAAANIAQNLIAQGIYDPEQGTFTGSGEAAGYGAGVGGLIQGLMDLAVPGRTRGGATAAAPDQLALPAPAPAALPAPTTVSRPNPLGLPRPGTAEARPATETPNVVVPPAQAGQVRGTDSSNIPALGPEAAATARSLAAEPQLQAAALAIENAGKATVPVIQDALGLSYPAAQGLMKKLEGAGVVSKFTKGKGRSLNLPFSVAATPRVAPEVPNAVQPAESMESADVETQAQPTSVDQPAGAKGATVDGQPPIAPKPKRDRASVPTPAPVVADGQTPSAGVDTEIAAAPNDGGLGEPSAPASQPDAPAAERAPTLEAAPADVQLQYSKQPDPDRKRADVRQVLAQNADETLGAVEGEILKDADGRPTRNLQIYNASLKDDVRGQGLGTQMYQEFIANAENEGLTVVSDNAVSQSAARVYDSLKKLGYAVTQAPDVRTKKDGRIETVSGAPVFTVASASTAPAVDRNAAPGVATGAPGQIIPQGIPPVRGRTLETQETAQREPIARQLTTKAKLESEAAAIKAQLASRRGMTAQAKTDGIKRSALEGRLRKRLNGVNTQLYNVTSYLRSEAGQQQAIAEGTTDAVNMMTRAENDSLRQQLRDWYSINAAPEVQAYDADIRGDMTGAERVAAQAAQRDPSTVTDKRKLLELLSMTREQLKRDPKAKAAYAYFSKTRDTADALDNIAFDSGSPDVPKRRVGAPKLGAPLEAYWQGTGKTTANTAAAWVESNMSEDTTAYMDEQIGNYVGYNADTVAATMDKEDMTRLERDKNETEYLKTYIDAEAALRGTEAFEGTTPEAMTREELRALDMEAMGPDIDFNEIGIDLGDALMRNKRRSISYGLESALHPAIIKALRAGNMRAVLQGIAATNVDPYIQNLAAKLVNYVGDTKVYTTSSSPRVRSLLTNATTGEVYAGTYVLMDKADYDRIVGETSKAYADSLQNSILINEATGLNAHTILHEMVHAATAREIKANPNGPFAKRMESLQADAMQAVGAEFVKRGEPLPYGFENMNEFVAEAMSNQEFQQLLDRIFPNTKRASALTQFVRNLLNFVRAKILNRPVKSYADTDGMSVFDEVDYLTQSVFSLAPEYAAKVSLYGDAMSPLRARAAFDTMGARVKNFTDVDRAKFEATLDNASITKAVRTTVANLFMPIRNLTESAKKYFPSADDVYQSIVDQRNTEERLDKLVSGTLQKTNTFLEANPQLEALFH